jgi:hypothetical protein
MQGFDDKTFQRLVFNVMCFSKNNLTALGLEQKFYVINIFLWISY